MNNTENISTQKAGSELSASNAVMQIQSFAAYYPNVSVMKCVDGVLALEKHKLTQQLGVNKFLLAVSKATGQSFIDDLQLSEEILKAEPGSKDTLERINKVLTVTHLLGLDQIEQYKPELENWYKKYPGVTKQAGLADISPEEFESSHQAALEEQRKTELATTLQIDTSSTADETSTQPAKLVDGNDEKLSGVELLADPEKRKEIERLVTQIRELVQPAYPDPYLSLNDLDRRDTNLPDINRQILQLQKALSDVLNLPEEESIRTAEDLRLRGRSRKRISVSSLLKGSMERGGQEGFEQTAKLLVDMFSKGKYVDRMQAYLEKYINYVRSGFNTNLVGSDFEEAEERIVFGTDLSEKRKVEKDLSKATGDFTELFTGQKDGTLEDVVKAFIKRNQAYISFNRYSNESDALMGDSEKNLARDAGFLIQHIGYDGDAIFVKIPPASEILTRDSHPNRRKTDVPAKQGPVEIETTEKVYEQATRFQTAFQDWELSAPAFQDKQDQQLMESLEGLNQILGLPKETTLEEISKELAKSTKEKQHPGILKGDSLLPPPLIIYDNPQFMERLQKFLSAYSEQLGQDFTYYRKQLKEAVDEGIRSGLGTNNEEACDKTDAMSLRIGRELAEGLSQYCEKSTGKDAAALQGEIDDGKFKWEETKFALEKAIKEKVDPATLGHLVTKHNQTYLAYLKAQTTLDEQKRAFQAGLAEKAQLEIIPGTPGTLPRLADKSGIELPADSQTTVKEAAPEGEVEYELVVNNMWSYPQAVEFERLLEAMPGFSSLYLQDLKRGKATLSVRLNNPETADNLISQITNMPDWNPIWSLSAVSKKEQITPKKEPEQSTHSDQPAPATLDDENSKPTALTLQEIDALPTETETKKTPAELIEEIDDQIDQAYRERKRMLAAQGDLPNDNPELLAIDTKLQNLAEKAAQILIDLPDPVEAALLWRIQHSKESRRYTGQAIEQLSPNLHQLIIDRQNSSSELQELIKGRMPRQPVSPEEQNRLADEAETEISNLKP